MRRSALALFDQATNKSNGTHCQGDSEQEQHQSAMLHECIHRITHHANETGNKITRLGHDGRNTSSIRASLLSKNLWLRVLDLNQSLLEDSQMS